MDDFDSAIADLMAKRAHLYETEAKPLIEIAATRAFTPEEKTLSDEVEAGLRRFDRALEQVRTQKEMQAQREKMGLAGGKLGGANAQPGEFVRSNDLRPAAVRTGQSFAAHPVAEEMIGRAHDRDAAMIGQHGDLGQMIRAMSTSGGSAIVPTVWAGNVIDRARNLSAVLQAGAQIVPMDAKVVQIGRLTADPTAGLRAVGDGAGPCSTARRTAWCTWRESRKRSSILVGCTFTSTRCGAMSMRST